MNYSIFEVPRVFRLTQKINLRGRMSQNIFDSNKVYCAATAKGSNPIQPFVTNVRWQFSSDKKFTEETNADVGSTRDS